ncbi:prepilin-type N-terminal cleavage/methylation domain-containing protein [Beggiatoa leptomitoformis]|uniref:Prepilin-type N-terminal cleavage/methylation domain-containing protein n=1 Tax=Beggiatoa leptomitoformis TaxID=288004 RepID=A0A2N9YGK2_9GAMM|nr:prepilin-type N-terminal cleavage/methylation domain-containing protein [Beggiatoa leptomitoformis]ALG68089.1 prepilin-type N-terminal cleavage/methylation domain-containing protein [Beggiatoa leptomitoformis]AUI69617.1 prepilin-type N-terminal cleavage/methylation domain-containing protein [Beggiatoa leptomitoformis]
MRTQQGFTLLEAIIAMAIVAIALGSLLSLLGSSKQLAFKAQANINEVILLRSALNVAQVLEKPEYPKLPAEQVDNMELETEDVLEPPKRQTQKIMLGLEPYQWTDKKKGILVSGIRWKKLTSAQ